MSTFSDYIVFVDESGDHDLSKVDEQFPVFCLSFCIIKKSDYISTISPALQKIKFDFWGHDHVIFHEHDIRKEKGYFGILRADKNIRENFYVRLNDMLDTAPFKIISSLIDKKRLLQKYTQPFNPYELAVLFCMERLQEFLLSMGEVNTIVPILFEARGRKEDDTLELEFRRICDNQTNWGYRSPDFKKFSYQLIFAQKSLNLPGLQIADMVARPIALNYLRPTQENRAYKMITRKLWGTQKTFP